MPRNVLPLDASAIYRTGFYARYRGQWFEAHQGETWPDELVIGARAGEMMPDGFSETPDGRFVASRIVRLGELEGISSVQSFCVWKNAVWSIDDVDWDQRVATLRRTLDRPRGNYAEPSPGPARIDFPNWPGVDAHDPEWISAIVRPSELARVCVEATPVDVNPTPVFAVSETAHSRPESLRESPWLPPERALTLVRQRITGDNMGDYPVADLQADRMRDGWRVWSVPPRTDDPLDIRLGWAIWYVADDGLMWRSSTSTAFTDAEQRMTAQFFERNQSVG